MPYPAGAQINVSPRARPWSRHSANRGRGTRSGHGLGACSLVASKTSRSEAASDGAGKGGSTMSPPCPVFPPVTGHDEREHGGCRRPARPNRERHRIPSQLAWRLSGAVRPPPPRPGVPGGSRSCRLPDLADHPGKGWMTVRRSTRGCGSRTGRPTCSSPGPTASPARCARSAWPARSNATNPAGSGAARSSPRGAIIAEKRPRGRPPADRGQLPEYTRAGSSHP